MVPKTIERAFEEARIRNERRLMVLSGKLKWKVKYLEMLVGLYLRKSAKKKAHFIYLTPRKDSKVSESVRGVIERCKEISLETIEFRDIDLLLGTNWDGMIIDLHEGISPNDLGKVVGTVKGNGVIIFLMPHLNEFEHMFTRFHKLVLVPPYTKEHVRHVFNRWFIKKLMEHDGIFIVEDGKVLKESRPKKKREEKPIKVEIPPDAEKPMKRIYKLCVTQDQINVAHKLKQFVDDERTKAFVLTSHRGRGKSSVIGLFLAYLVASCRTDIVVTSPERINVKELFRFMEIGLKKFGIKIKVWDKIANKEDILIKRTGSRIRYFPSYKIEKVKADIIVVDEAAAIPANILFAALDRAKKTIYSTTQHGYEGAGRTFNIRFLKSLEDQSVEKMEYEMVEPIRYGEQDPIEKWLFDVLLLDAEPSDMPESLNIREFSYKKYDIERLVFTQESKLREIFGIFITAHYRNNPNDFGMICDAPHHEIRTLECEGRVVCAVQLAKEGGLEKESHDMYYGHSPSGHLIPDRMIKHYREVNFGKMEGLRIVRIAVHPALMRRGIGSKMLDEIGKEAKKAGYSWAGASFGATPELLKFWMKNNFVPVHMAPAPNPSTGEYSTIVVKPMKKDAKRLFEHAYEEFVVKLVDSLVEPYNEVDPRIVLSIMERYRGKSRKEIDEMTSTQWKRLVAYAFSTMTYESCRDCVYKLVKLHFMSKNRAKLKDEENMLLISKVLQAKRWEDVKEEMKRGGIVFWMIELKDLMKKLVRYYGKGKIDENEIKKLDREFKKLMKEKKMDEAS